MKELMITTGKTAFKYKMINVYFVNTLDQSITRGGMKVLEHLFDNPKFELSFSPRFSIKYLIHV